jgi:putative transposase
MGRPPLPFRLRATDRERLEGMLKKGLQQVRVTTRVMTLLQLDQGLSAPQVATLVRLSPAGVHKIAARYRRGGMERALFARPRPGAAQVLSSSEKQRIIALVCSTPPDGATRWTVRLITEEVLKRKLVPQVGRETIRVLLQSHDLKPWREKNVVHRRAHAGVHRVHGGRAGAV